MEDINIITKSKQQVTSAATWPWGYPIRATPDLLPQGDWIRGGHIGATALLGTAYNCAVINAQPMASESGGGELRENMLAFLSPGYIWTTEMTQGGARKVYVSGRESRKGFSTLAQVQGGPLSDTYVEPHRSCTPFCLGPCDQSSPVILCSTLNLFPLFKQALSC